MPVYEPSWARFKIDGAEVGRISWTPVPLGEHLVGQVTWRPPYPVYMRITESPVSVAPRYFLHPQDEQPQAHVSLSSQRRYPQMTIYIVDPSGKGTHLTVQAALEDAAFVAMMRRYADWEKA